MEKKERVFNRCSNCGHRPGLYTTPPWTVAECGICKQIQSAANYPELVKRWNEANPKGEPENGAKPEPIWTALEGEPEFNLAPESEPVLPKNSAANPCKCGGNVIYFQTIGGEHWFICSKCGQKLSSKISYMDLVAKWNDANPNLPAKITLSKAFSPIKEIRLTARIDDLDLESEPETEPETEPEDETDMAPESEPCLPPGWSHATAFSENPKIYVWNHGGDPDQESETETEPERPNLDPGRGPCTCPGFNSPLQYQVGGDHYRRFSYQPVMFFRETNLDFDRANAIKYLARVGHKGDPVEDIEKAAQYLQFYEVRRMYENSLCEQFVDQIDEVPIRHAIRYLFSGEVTLAKMAIDKVLEMYRKPEAEQ